MGEFATIVVRGGCSLQGCSHERGVDRVDGRWPTRIGLVVMTLAWWLEAVGNDKNAFVSTHLADVIDDTTWVLNQLASELLEIETPTIVKQTVPTSKATSKPKSKCNRSQVLIEDEPQPKR